MPIIFGATPYGAGPVVAVPESETTYYCTQADMELMIGAKYLAQLTNEDTSSTPSPAVVEAMIQRAQNYMDAQMSGTYATPLDPVPGIVRDICVDLAIYNCFLRKFSMMEVPKQWQDKYKEALNRLEMICIQDITFDPDIYPVTAAQAEMGSHSNTGTMLEYFA